MFVCVADCSHMCAVLGIWDSTECWQKSVATSPQGIFDPFTGWDAPSIQYDSLNVCYVISFCIIDFNSMIYQPIVFLNNPPIFFLSLWFCLQIASCSLEIEHRVWKRPICSWHIVSLKKCHFPYIVMLVMLVYPREIQSWGISKLRLPIILQGLFAWYWRRKPVFLEIHKFGGFLK